MNDKKEYIVNYPVAFPTVDIAVVKLDLTESHWFYDKVMLIQKPDEIEHGHWRFPGGFVDPTDESMEAAAFREAGEELDVKLSSEIEYIGSAKVPDPRYADSPHKIITSLFMCIHMEGEDGKGHDDVAVTKWFSVEDVMQGRVKENPIHAKLFDLFREFIKNYN